jgi:regulatory protein
VQARRSIGSSSSATNLKARALRLLAARDYGRAELTRKLQVHAENPEALQATLDDLQAKGFINEERAAASLLNRRANKLGAARVLQELRHQGFDEELIAIQAEILRESEEIRIKNVWEKKFSKQPTDASNRAKQMRFLASRGFASNQIGRLMRSLEQDND